LNVTLGGYSAGELGLSSCWGAAGVGVYHSIDPPLFWCAPYSTSPQSIAAAADNQQWNIGPYCDDKRASFLMALASAPPAVSQSK
jgi:hypothetical protein